MPKKCARFAAILLLCVLPLCLLAVPAGAAGEQAIETMFSGCTGGGRSNLSLKLEGDTATFSYSPVFYVERNFPGYEPLTDADAAKIVNMCVAGFKQWGGKYEVRGRTLTLVMDIDAKQTTNRSQASVRVVPREKGDSAGTTSFSLLFWRPGHSATVTLRPRNPMDNRFYENMPAHELGHAMGIWDAYGYSDRFDSIPIFGRIMSRIDSLIQPEAPESRIPVDAVMRRGSDLTIYGRDVEMVLWAWKNGKMQLYTESIWMLLFLWFEVSPAFSQ